MIFVEHVCSWCGKAIKNNEETIREWASGEKTHEGDCAKEFGNSRGLS